MMTLQEHLEAARDYSLKDGYTLEQLAELYELGTLEDKLWQIIEAEYETFVIEADWNEEFPKSDEIKFEEE